MTGRLRIGVAAGLLVALALAAGASADEASAPADVQDVAASGDADHPEGDPWESMNRPIFNFNEGLDVWVLEPVATGWDKVMPEPVQTSIGNLFDHLALPNRFANDLLQAKFYESGETFFRALINTTMGLGGLFDPATHFTVHESNEDFGQTLGAWGVPAGPYLVLPLLGPSNPRDTAGVIAESSVGLIGFFAPYYVSVPAGAVDVVNDRAAVLEEIAAERASAFDFYSFVRNAAVSYRENQVNDRAEEPDEDEDDDLYYTEDEDE
jgi:phospholipid-binding lipoprotein MlaA